MNRLDKFIICLFLLLVYTPLVSGRDVENKTSPKEQLQAIENLTSCGASAGPLGQLLRAARCNLRAVWCNRTRDWTTPPRQNKRVPVEVLSADLSYRSPDFAGHDRAYWLPSPTTTNGAQ